MELSSAFYGAIAFSFLFYFCLQWLRSASPKNSIYKVPPEAGGSRLITGHLHLVSGTSSAGLPHFNLGSLADKYGQIFTIRLGVRRILVVSSWELAKELFTTHDIAVSSRPRVKANKHMGYNFALFGFSPYGPYWRELRKLANTELLSSRRIEMQSNVRVSEINQSINELYKLWEEKKDRSGRVLVDMKKWVGNLNLNVILRTVAGKRFSSGEDNEEETRRVREAFRDLFYLTGLFVPADALPYLGWLDLGGLERRMKETAKVLDEIVGGWLVEHRQKQSSSYDKPQDFMDVLVSTVKGANLQSEYDEDTIIKATSMAVIAGGTDTTSIMIVWALSLLLNNPHVLKKAQAELDKHVGRERRVDESDIKNLVYLQAIAKETFRLYPAGPLGGPREFTKDCNVGGYYIPKGTWLIINLWKLQRDPKVWPDEPLEFKPERFLNEYKHLDVKGQDFELIPFGAGRRICPGANIGVQMLHSVLANLLQAFDLSTVSDQQVDMSESAGMTNSKPTPLDVLVVPRLSPNLY